MASSKTRAKILDTALALFNEQGTEAVSTNHIAAAAGISPGNLYYYFRNKAEIIRTLVEERLFPALNALWSSATTAPPSIEGLRMLIYRHFETLWEYRFFREVLNLILNDSLLGERYREIHDFRVKNVLAALESFQAAGLLRKPSTPTGTEQIVTSAWVITTYWLSYLETIGTPITPAQMQRGADLILGLLEPYWVGDET